MAKKTSKPAGKKNSKNQIGEKQISGKNFNEQDPKRRLGNFGGSGEHPRQGSRTAGIVGQTKQRNKTDKSGKEK